MQLTDKMEINRPDVVAEVAELCAGYERALIHNDVDALQQYFWDSSLALRFGATEELYGAREISDFRKARVVNFSSRKSTKDTLVTFGSDFAVATAEFSFSVNEQARHGRQSQVWARLPSVGWRIISAHVSHKVTPCSAAAFSATAGDYADAVSAILNIPIAPEHREGVAANLDVMAQIAAPLMAFELPEAEPAPTFTP